ncbi:hypothetical protein KR026_000232 [Drosophila bipectinata]|nr:hypothetical protein KR026_000232 [Drosophila bipectinata]
MNTMKGDDKPFNPFYIGPHPSKACAIPEIPGRQCSPPCLPAEGTVRATTTTATATHGHPVSNPVPSGHTGGMLIVGVSGPSGGMANIYSCSEALAAAVGAGNRTATGMATGGAAGPARGGAAHGPGNTICKPYPCMEGARSNGPGC